MKKIFPFLICVFFWLSFRGESYAADARFTVTSPGDASVIMDNTSGTLSITVTNTSSLNRKIKFIQLTVDNTLYNFHSANETPAGWLVSELDDTYQPGVAMIEYSAFQAQAQLSRGDSVTFSVMLTGPSGGAIVQDSNDRTDTFLDVRAWEKGTLWFRGDEALREGTIPVWARKGLKCEFFASPSALPINQDIHVVASITNVSSTAQNNIQLISLQKSGTGNAVLTDGPNPSSLILESGETGEIQGTFNATANGELTLSVIASNSNVTSDRSYSNEIYIGYFTAQLEVKPASVTNGNEVTLMMSVSNNHPTASAHNVVPSTPQFSGDASGTLIDGPNPPSLSILAPGETFYYFTWIYRINGDAGDDYTFSAFAGNDEGYPSNTAVSNTGIISVVVFSVDPVSINSGSVNQPFTFNIQNGGKKRVKIDSIEIYHPSTDFVFGSASGGYNGNWAVTPKTDSVLFEAVDDSQYLPGGEQMDLTVVYQQTPFVTSSTEYEFFASIHGSVNFKVFSIPLKFEFTEEKAKTIVVTNTVIDLEYEPPDLSADGNAETTVTLTLLDGDIAMPGKPVDFQFIFSESFESNPVWTYRESITDDQGQARARFRAPYNATNCSVTVQGIYCSTVSQIAIPFIGYDRPNILYSGGLTPTQVYQGEAVQFSLDVRNTSESYDMNLTTDSYFRVTDSSLGGMTEYKAFLLSSTTVPAGEVIVTLTYEIASFPTSFMHGQFTPTIFCSDGDPQNDQTRDVSDKLTVESGSSGICIIDWKIKR